MMDQAKTSLLDGMGAGRWLNTLTPVDADAYHARLRTSRLAKATIAKRLRYARHFMKVAPRRRLIDENPFAHITGAVAGNPARRKFVPASTIEQVIRQAPDPQWKLLIALARYGGLRIPSEALSLTWDDVDLKKNQFTVRSSKTAHHPDGGVRVVPMFPELRPYFQAVYDQAKPGEMEVITRYRHSTVNLRTQFLRYITAAGLNPWPKLWQNLRASRATDLANRFPSHVASAWLGHTEKIADEFYRMVTDEHFQNAIRGDEKAAQNPAQHMHVSSRNAPQGETSVHPEGDCLQEVTAECENVQNAEVGQVDRERRLIFRLNKGFLNRAL